MELSPFIPGKSYKRSSIHDQFGGNRQAGIASSASAPYIFIFSGKSGHQHGYKDGWLNENIFVYSGEGQIGDMKFVRGNIALRDHIRSGKRVFLFVEDKKAYWKFESEVTLKEFGFDTGPDTEGNLRLIIRFFFKRAGVYLDYPDDETNFYDDGDKKKVIVTEKLGLVTSRVGQGAYRKSILFRWEFKCAVTEYTGNEILIASHILPWKDSNNDERLDVNNGILLSPTYDALFDQHLISFENSGKIILSDTLLKTNYSDIGVTGKESIRKFNKDNYYYLDKHREKIC